MWCIVTKAWLAISAMRSTNFIGSIPNIIMTSDRITAGRVIFDTSRSGKSIVKTAYGLALKHRNDDNGKTAE